MDIKGGSCMLITSGSSRVKRQSYCCHTSNIISYDLLLYRPTAIWDLFVLNDEKAKCC